MKIKRILWPTDFSEASNKSLQAAQHMANQFSAELYIINVVLPVPVSFGYAGGSNFNIPLYQEELKKTSEKQLDEFVEGKIDKKIKTKSFVVQGPEVSSILNFANEQDVDLIVISTHGYTGLKRLLMGSVAEGVIRHAKQPVLTIRVTEDELKDE